VSPAAQRDQCSESTITARETRILLRMLSRVVTQRILAIAEIADVALTTAEL
jgi:hypothetical protein